MKRAAVSCAAVLLLLAGGAAAEEDGATQQAKELFRKAEVHFSVGEFPRALELYTEAYKTKSLPAFLFNIGQCHRNMGRCDRALFFFKQYLIKTPEAPNRGDVEKLIEICEKQTGRSGADEGTKKEPEKQEKPAVVEPEKPDRRDDAPLPGPTRPGRRLRPLWFWSSVGLCGALLVTGTVTGVMALGQSDEYKDPSTSISRRRDLKDSGETLRSVSTATVIAGAVAAAGAGVLFFVTDWGKKEPAGETTVSAGPLPGGAALMIGGRF